MSLVMIHDIRPVDMDNDEMQAAAVKKDEYSILTGRFAEIMEEMEPRKDGLTLYGIFFSSTDEAMVAAFKDTCQTCRLRAELAGGLQEFRKDQELKYPKKLLLITLLRPLAQLPLDVLRALQGKQRELFPLRAGKRTLPVHEVALGHETVWMHREVDEFMRVTLR